MQNSHDNTNVDPGFVERTSAFLKNAAAAAREWYTDDGQWRASSAPAIGRERFWICFALYAEGHAALADAVIRVAETARYGDIVYDVFDNNIAVALLLQHGDAMAPDVRAKLEQLGRFGFSFAPGNRQPDYQFHGYNDNMPAKATLGLVLGGELLNEPEAVDYGLWQLRQMRAQLTRRGINSEFNSPTYTPLALHAMAAIREFAKNPEAREVAGSIEARLWLDIAARFHPEMGMPSGPHSRYYTVDALGHASIMASLLWFVLGDKARPSPQLLFDPASGLVLHHMGDAPFNIAQMCWIAAGHYHLPPIALELFSGKTYPFHAVATFEGGDFGPDVPARDGRIETVLYPDFTLASSNAAFLNGAQTTTYFATYKRRENIESFHDLGTVYSAIVINDDVPGFVPGSHYSNSGEADCLASHAQSLVLQSESTALVLTHPQLVLAGSHSQPHWKRPARQLSRISEMVLFPIHNGGGAAEILVGGEKRESWEGTVPRGSWVTCRYGRMLVGIRPLCYTGALGEPRIALERIDNYNVLRVTFYEGEARTFTRAELCQIFGGFVAEHAGVDDYASLADFAAELESTTRFTDYYWATRRTRYRRLAGRKPALEMETSWSPGSQTQRFATINGRQLDCAPLTIDGVDPAMLPFLGEPFKPIEGFFPWEELKMVWMDWPSAIGDRETND